MRHNISLYQKFVDNQVERQKLRENLSRLDLEAAYYNKMCQHDIGFKVYNYMSKKTGVVETIFCPICGKNELIFYGHGIEKTVFIKSKIVNLTNLQVSNVEKLIKLIRELVISDLSYYYDEDNDVADLEKSLYEIINKNNMKLIKK